MTFAPLLPAGATVVRRPDGVVELRRPTVAVETYLLDRGLNPLECSEEQFQKAMAEASEQPPLK